MQFHSPVKHDSPRPKKKGCTGFPQGRASLKRTLDSQHPKARSAPWPHHRDLRVFLCVLNVLRHGQALLKLMQGA